MLVIALIILVLLVLLYWHRVRNLAPPAPAPAAPQSSGSKYDTLLALLEKTPTWLYFDEKTRTRQQITFQLDRASQQVTISSSFTPKPATFKYQKAGGRDDTLMMLDPSKGDASAYQMLLMYVDDKHLVVEEKTAGKITFQQALSV